MSINWGNTAEKAPAKEFPSQSNTGGPPKKVYPQIPKGNVVGVEVVQIAIENLKPEYIKDPETTTKVSFHLKVDDGTVIDGVDYSGAHIWGTSKPWFNPSPKCRLRLWLQALLGVDEWPEGFTPQETLEVNKRGDSIRVMHEFDGLKAKALVGGWQGNTGWKMSVDDLAPAPAYEDAEDLF